MKARVRDFCFTLLGLAGLMVYVLACGPSFSPDGSKVAFPVIDGEAGQTSIVVYDIQKKTLETIANFAYADYTGGEDDDLGLALSVQWMPDGQRILVNTFFSIMMLPVGSKGSIRMLELKEEMETYPFIPEPVIGNYQFLTHEGKPKLYRVNLQNWEIQPFSSGPEDEEGLLFADGEHLYLASTDTDGEDFYSIAKLNVEDGTRTILARINSEECGKLEGFWLKLGKDRYATSSRYQDTAHIVLIRGDSIERMIPVGEKGSRISIGNLVAPPDEERIFAPLFEKLDDSKNVRFSIMEVPLDGGKTRQVPLFSGDPGGDDNEMLYFQIALSPDGKEIAASSLSFGHDAEIKPQDRALYLIDISRPQWNVDKIQVPLASSSNRKAGKK